MGELGAMTMNQIIDLASRRRALSVPVNGRVTPPKRKSNKESRVREYLTPDEITRLMQAARAGRYPQRDQALILIAFRHGLRVSELIAIRWDQIDLKAGTIHVNRLKGGIPSVHPLRGPELRALRPIKTDSPYVFCSERGGPMTSSNVRKIVAKLGVAAKIEFPIHPHMLRHSTGYQLANDGQDTRSLAHYLGHANIQNTAKYTALSPNRFKDFFKD
jgi:type 1 fimbriae regulatory protein FimB/type 1 fimbriae regulatory protein FimE